MPKATTGAPAPGAAPTDGKAPAPKTPTSADYTDDVKSKNGQ